MVRVVYADVSAGVKVNRTYVPRRMSLLEVIRHVCGDVEISELTIHGSPVDDSQINKTAEEVCGEHFVTGDLILQIEKRK